MKQVELYGTNISKNWYWKCDCTCVNFEKDCPDFNPETEHITVTCPHCKNTSLANLWIPYDPKQEEK